MRESIVYMNGDFVPDHEARVPILTHALHYGTGVFEGIRAYHDPGSGEIMLFRPTDHFERMRRNGTFLNLPLPASPEEMTRIAAELIRRNDFASDVYIRPLAYKAATKVGVMLPPENGFAMIAVPMGAYLDTRKGLHCGISTWRRLPDNSIPCRAKICGAYVNSALAAQEARDRGFDEAIFLNEAGRVAEGSAMNLFLVRDGRLVTPDVSQGILEGLTRDTVMKLGWDLLKVTTDARSVDRAELYIADEAFLCGTAAQIAPITRIDGHMIGDGQPGEITIELRSLYDRLVRGGLPAYQRWLTPVYGRAGQLHIVHQTV